MSEFVPILEMLLAQGWITFSIGVAIIAIGIGLGELLLGIGKFLWKGKEKE